MKKTIITYGLISGVIASLMMGVTVPLADKISFDQGLVLGYTTIVLAFLLVFFGIRSYRDNDGGGQITFAKGFAIGISITLIMCVCYVVTWEIIYFNFMHDFMAKYSAHLLAKSKASGASPAALAAQAQELNRSKQLYDNPLYNIAMTFIEPFPVGLVIALISAAVLRKKSKEIAAGAAVAASS